MYKIFKRICDISLSLVLLVTLCPLFLLLAVIIFLQDFGNPIFSQERVGVDGELFMFYKFRSMPLDNPNVESHQRHLIKITPFGKFIRRTNLDELPQFWNVLIGDMSFIGPRPPIPSQKNLVELRSFNGAIKVRPGLTGWAQVNSYDYMPEKEKARFDGEYADGISLTLDLLILLKTVVYFTRKPPTY